jgi:hypothetical protein
MLKARKVLWDRCFKTYILGGLLGFLVGLNLDFLWVGDEREEEG